jgi:GntR family transcriptional repressor for pyruvate dehydrogenase complex
VSDRVASRLQSLILSRAVSRGERLPSERELCQLLGVSRTALREGVRSLVAKGLLEVRQGGGTVVTTPDVRAASELLAIVLRLHGDAVFDQVHDVRRLVEVEIASVAASKRTDRDVEILERAVAEMPRSGGHAWAMADVRFHAALADASHNPLYPVILGSMADLLIELRVAVAGLPGRVEGAEFHHRAVLDAVIARDAAAARRAMREHMDEAATSFQRARLMRGLEATDAS